MNSDPCPGILRSLRFLDPMANPTPLVQRHPHPPPKHPLLHHNLLPPLHPLLLALHIPIRQDSHFSPRLRLRRPRSRRHHHVEVASNRTTQQAAWPRPQALHRRSHHNHPRSHCHLALA